MLAILLLGCSPHNKAVSPATVHSIDLPVLSPELPELAGRKQFVNACTSCHSARYILMQPELSATAWTTEVNKMRKAYGCPVEEAQVAPLVDFLTALQKSSQHR